MSYCEERFSLFLCDCLMLAHASDIICGNCVSSNENSHFDVLLSPFVCSVCVYLLAGNLFILPEVRHRKCCAVGRYVLLRKLYSKTLIFVHELSRKRNRAEYRRCINDRICSLQLFCSEEHCMLQYAYVLTLGKLYVLGT